MPRGLGGSDLAAESRMRRGHVRVHVHITRACVHSGPAPGWGSDGHGALWPHAPRGPRAWLSDGAALPVGPHFEGPGANPPFRGRDYN